MTGRLKLVEKPPTVTTYPFPQPQVNMVNLNWPEEEKGKLMGEISPNMGRIAKGYYFSWSSYV